jgi:hypothetical protein
VAEELVPGREGFRPPGGRVGVQGGIPDARRAVRVQLEERGRQAGGDAAQVGESTGEAARVKAGGEAPSNSLRLYPLAAVM